MAAAKAGLVYQAHGRALCGGESAPVCARPPCGNGAGASGGRGGGDGGGGRGQRRGPQEDTDTAESTSLDIVDPDPDSPAAQTELAAFLVAMGNHSYYLCGPWQHVGADGMATAVEPVEPTWSPLYDRPLGEPLSHATLEAGVWRRSFRSGTNATFNIHTNKGTVSWASHWPVSRQLAA